MKQGLENKAVISSGEGDQNTGVTILNDDLTLVITKKY